MKVKPNVRNEILEDLRAKKIDIDEMGAVIAAHFPHIDSISYQIFVKHTAPDQENLPADQETELTYEEFLVVNYRGGAHSIRNCYANSTSVTLREIVDRINGGVYNTADERDYEKFYNSSEYYRITADPNPNLTEVKDESSR